MKIFFSSQAVLAVIVSSIIACQSQNKRIEIESENSESKSRTDIELKAKSKSENELEIPNKISSNLGIEDDGIYSVFKYSDISNDTLNVYSESIKKDIRIQYSDVFFKDEFHIIKDLYGNSYSISGLTENNIRIEPLWFSSGLLWSETVGIDMTYVQAHAFCANHGAVLPTEKQMRDLVKSIGAVENKARDLERYEMGRIPGMLNNWYYTVSEDSSLPTLFHGKYGIFQVSYRFFKASVRCVIAPPKVSRIINFSGLNEQ